MNKTSTHLSAMFLFFALTLLQHQTTRAFSPSLFTKSSLSYRVIENNEQMTGIQLRLAGFQDAFASSDALDDYVSEKKRQQKALKRCHQVRNLRSSKPIIQERKVDSMLRKRNRAYYMIHIIKTLAKKLITAFKMFTEPSCDMIHPVYLHNISDQ